MNLIRRRTIAKCYVIWLLTGIFGGHYFYCFQYEAGFVYLFTLGIFLFGWLGDIFIIPFLVFQTNNIIDQKNERRVNDGLGENIVDNPFLTLMTVKEVVPTYSDGELQYGGQNAF